MRIAVLQTAGRGTRIADNLALLREATLRAEDRGANLLVTPEMFATGYNISPDTVSSSAESRNGALFHDVADIAAQHRMALVVGYPERDGDSVYNAAMLVDDTGALKLNYRKSHLFGDIDRRAFSAGDGVACTTELGAFRVGLLICYDVEFPENARALALLGADLVLVPTALMKPYQFVPRSMLPTRAFENQIFIAYANRCGQEKALHYEGLSVVVAPNGDELARAGDEEALLVAQLDPHVQHESRALNTYLRDRRPTLYAGLSESTTLGPRKTS